MKRGFTRKIFTIALRVEEITENEAVEETKRSRNSSLSPPQSMSQQTWRLKKAVSKADHSKEFNNHSQLIKFQFSLVSSFKKLEILFLYKVGIKKPSKIRLNY